MYDSIIQHQYLESCSPPKVTSASITMYLTPFLLYHLPHPPFPLSGVCLSCLFICCFQFSIPPVSEVILSFSLSVWLILLSVIFSLFIRVVTDGGISSFLWLSCEYPIVDTHHIFIQPSIAGRVGSFHVSAIVNNAAMNMGWIHLYK